MDEGFSIVEITSQEYMTCNPSHRLLENDYANYYYKIGIGRESYFINSNRDRSRFEIKKINDNDHLIFGSEDRVYIFSLSNGQIKMALRTFYPILEFRVHDGLLLIFSEMMMLVFGVNDIVFHSAHQFPDLIEDIIINNREVTVVCFETAPIKVRI